MITFTAEQIAAWYGSFFWPLVRVLALFSTAPVLSHRAIPVRVKIGLALLVALILVPQVQSPPIDGAFSGAGIGLLAYNILIGALIGFTVRLVFAALELTGEIIGLQMGLSFAGYFNPASGQTQNAVGSYLSLLAVLMFVAIDGHLWLLAAIAESFRQFPVEGPVRLPQDFLSLAKMGSGMFALGLAIALPFIAVALLVNIVLGVLARVAPQLNIFAVGFPLTIMVGLGSLFVLLPWLESPLRTALERSLSVWLR
jgi:flagellar biosynthesis protein FliR